WSRSPPAPLSGVRRRCSRPKSRSSADALRYKAYDTADHVSNLRLDQAGWQGGKALKVPNNISLLQLPPRAPELNGQENNWQFMRQTWLSNQIFKSFDDIVDHCCYAWNTLIDQPWKIMSIARRDWAAAGHSI